MTPRHLLPLAALLLLTPAARAGNIPGPLSLATTTENAELIVIATLSDFIPDPPLPRNPQPLITTDPAEIVRLLAFRPAGTYTLAVTQTLKGDPVNDLQFHLPLLSSFHYDNSQFNLPKDAPILLLLKKDDRNLWIPVDPHRPLIPLATNVAKAAATQPVPAKPDIPALLYASLPDKDLRPALLHILRYVKDYRAVTALRPYADDPDLRARAQALRALALNQDLTAIPKIAALAVESEKAAIGSGPTDALQSYTTPNALPLLLPLIVEGTDYTRLNAIMAIGPLRNQSAIPYLLKALDDPGKKHIDSQAAALLHLLNPALGPAHPGFSDGPTLTADIAAIKTYYTQHRLPE